MPGTATLMPGSELLWSVVQGTQVKKRQFNDLISNELSTGSGTKSYCFLVAQSARFPASLCVPVLGFSGTGELAQCFH